MSATEIIPEALVAIPAEQHCLAVADGVICVALKDHEGDHAWRDENKVMIELQVMNMGGKR